MLKYMLSRRFSTFGAVLSKKRPTEWKLPDLDKLPGGFRGKVYNRRDWTDYLKKNTDIVQQEESKSEQRKDLKPPPKGWRRMNLPQYMRNKYALREKALRLDLTKTKRLSRTAMEGIKLLHNKYPTELTTHKLSEFFKISPISISKILKSKWSPSVSEKQRKQEHWEKRGEKLIKEQMLDHKLDEYFKAKQEELNMKIPYFVKQELTSYVHLHTEESLGGIFENLNECRKRHQRIKDEKNELGSR